MRKNFGKILVGLVAVIVLAVVFMRGDQLENLITTIEKGTPLFLVLAVVFQLGKYFSQGASFIWCFKAVDARLGFWEGVKLVFSTFFVDTVVPSFNMSGTSVVIKEASRDNIAAGRATGAALLRQVSINAGFLVIMIIGFVILAIAGGLKPGWVALGIVAVLVVGGMVGAMAFAAAKPDLLIKWTAPLVKLADKVAAKFKKNSVDAWVKQTIDTYSSAAKMMVGNRRDVVIELALSVLASFFEMCCFAFTGVAFGVHSLEALVCGYVVVTLFAMLSIIPQGVGVVEAAALVTFSLFGIEQATGMAVVMVYRAIVFWLPFLVGAVVIQKSKLLKEPANAKDSTPATDSSPANGMPTSTAPIGDTSAGAASTSQGEPS